KALPKAEAHRLGERVMVVRQRGLRAPHVLGIGAFVAAGLLGAAANSQTQQQVDWCNNKGRAFAPDLVISGCTAVIQSDKELKDLAIAYINRGDASEHKGDHDRAIADYNEAIWLSPFPRAFSNRGIVYFNRKDYDRAIADFTEAIRLNPNIAYVFNDRAGAYKAKWAYEDDEYKARGQLDDQFAVAVGGGIREHDQAGIWLASQLRNRRVDLRGFTNWGGNDLERQLRGGRGEVCLPEVGVVRIEHDRDTTDGRRDLLEQLQHFRSQTRLNDREARQVA